MEEVGQLFTTICFPHRREEEALITHLQSDRFTAFVVERFRVPLALFDVESDERMDIFQTVGCVRNERVLFLHGILRVKLERTRDSVQRLIRTDPCDTVFWCVHRKTSVWHRQMPIRISLTAEVWKYLSPVLDVESQSFQLSGVSTHCSWGVWSPKTLPVLWRFLPFLSRDYCVELSWIHIVKWRRTAKTWRTRVRSGTEQA